jgi:hypothetical protein
MFGHFKEIGSQYNTMTISYSEKITDNSISSQLSEYIKIM